jgi:lysophospholipid acyltransferase (LPLAT)-like uncharacterized protein
VSLRRRIEKSNLASGAFGGLLSRYLVLCDRTTDWQIDGLEAMKDALSEGPILSMMWHSRMAIGAPHWPSDLAPVSSLHHTRDVCHTAQSGGLAHVGETVPSRLSIVMTGDDPVGSAHKLQDAPLDWASRLGAPGLAYAFSTTRGHRFNSWDRLLLPYPYGRGAQVFARYKASIPRKLTAQARLSWRRSLEDFLDETTARANTILGLPPGP